MLSLSDFLKYYKYTEVDEDGVIIGKEQFVENYLFSEYYYLLKGSPSGLATSIKTPEVLITSYVPASRIKLLD
jgi:hypothetical protein